MNEFVGMLVLAVVQGLTEFLPVSSSGHLVLVQSLLATREGDVLFDVVLHIGTLGSVAMLYFLMAASFLGALQLIVYAGGTLIVIVFGIMLTSQTFRMRFAPKRIEVAAGAALSLILFAALASILTGADWSGSQPDDDGFTVAEFGNALLTDYLVPFEIASVLLLAVMIGAAYLSWQERE